MKSPQSLLFLCPTDAQYVARYVYEEEGVYLSLSTQIAYFSAIVITNTSAKNSRL